MRRDARAPLVALAAFYPALAAAELTLQLKPQVEQRTMTLSVCDVVEPNAALRAMAESPCAPLPGRGRVGDTVAYGRADIARALSTRTAAPPTLRWRGPQRVLVERRGERLDADTYVMLALEQLRAHLATSGDRIELRPVGTYRDVAIPTGARTVTARFSGGDRGRSARVLLDVAVDGTAYTTLAVAFDVRRYAPALVLKQDGARHQALVAAQIEAVVGAVSSANGDAVTDTRQLAGQRLRHALPAGVPIGSDDVEPSPAIAAGAAVDVFASTGRVLVRTRGTAEREGRLGERIRVLLPANNERLAVEVIGENRTMVSAHVAP